MRYLATFGMAALAMLFWSPATPCAAQDFPSGSYQQTCSDIGTRGDTLYARCQDRDGRWHSTQLRINNCSGDIVNMNGRLTCGGGGNGYGYDRQQQGAWQGRDRDNDNDSDDRGRWNNGRYNGNWNNGGMPAGDYVQTCRNVRMEGNTLRAQCEERGGGWHDTSLRNVGTCSQGVVNDNGNLRCTR